MDYRKKYIKYKIKYLAIKYHQKGGGKYWKKQKDKHMIKLLDKLPQLLWNLSDKTNLIKWLKKCKGDDFDDFDNLIKNKQGFITIIKSLNYDELLFLDEAEKLNVIKTNDIPNLNISQIRRFIKDENFKLSYSLSIHDKLFESNGNHIYAMHSIGKVFTGMLIILALKNRIIETDILDEPIKLDVKILSLLPLPIKERLNETTFFEIMTHTSGLLNYLPKYTNTIRLAIENETDIPNPLNPEDFIKYGDERLSDPHKYKYSNLGLLLCGLSIEYLYNLKSEKKLNYNNILQKYILDPAGLSTFSISRPDDPNVKYPETDINARYLNGSPAGGYWISCNDLRKFGKWCSMLYNTDHNIREYITKYGLEFYNVDKNIISHSGGIPSSSAQLTTFPKMNITISIMSHNGKDAIKLYNALFLYA